MAKVTAQEQHLDQLMQAGDDQLRTQGGRRSEQTRVACEHWLQACKVSRFRVDPFKLKTLAILAVWP